MLKLYDLYNFRNLSTPEKKLLSNSGGLGNLGGFPSAKILPKKQTKLRRNRLTIESRKMLCQLPGTLNNQSSFWLFQLEKCFPNLYFWEKCLEITNDPLKKKLGGVPGVPGFRKHQAILDRFGSASSLAATLPPAT